MSSARAHPQRGPLQSSSPAGDAWARASSHPGSPPMSSPASPRSQATRLHSVAASSRGQSQASSPRSRYDRDVRSQAGYAPSQTSYAPSRTTTAMPPRSSYGESMPTSPTSTIGGPRHNYAASVSSQQQYPPQQPRQAYPDPRSAYPTFLPLADSLMLQATWFMNGLRDAWRWDIVARLLATDPELRANAAKAALLNGLSALFALALDALVHPFTLNSERGFFARNLGLLYTLIWLAPLAAASLWFNSTWTAALARRSYTLRFGPAAFVPPPAPTRNTYLLLLHTLATSAYRFTMLTTCALLSFSLGRIPIPILGTLAETAYFSWVNSYYFFEHVWIARGSSLNERVRGLEERWAYYAAFGLPATLACSCTYNPLFNMALFAALCPPYVLMSTHARPAPQEPYAPKGNNAFPSPLVPIRMPVFQPAIWVDDMVLRAIEWITRRKVGGGTALGREREGKKKDGLGPRRGWSGAEGAEAGNARTPRLRQGQGHKKVD